MTSIRRKSSNVLLTYQLMILAAIMFGIAGTWFLARAADDVQAAPLTVQVEVPAPQPQPVATPLYIHMEWGQEMYVICSQSAESDPAGQISQDILGSDVIHGTCNPPGTVKGE